MKLFSSTSLMATLLVCVTLAVADNKPPSPKMNEPTRMMLIRGLNAELVFMRMPLPMGRKGLVLKDGKITPDGDDLERLLATVGPAVKPGDRARITAVRFKGDNAIIFEINGGPERKKKWYEHIEVGGPAGTVSPTDPNADPNANPRGSFVVLAFDKYVPQMSVEQVKELLRPVFDFNATSSAQAYIETLPPKLKEAIKNHKVLVGMNRDMVTYALGRPPKKHRERDGNTEYEEWIYGEPPKEVQFVRFVGDEVVRLEIMKVDGEKMVRTEREIDIKPTLAAKQQQEDEKLSLIHI